jgi:hypothetical protein
VCNAANTIYPGDTVCSSLTAQIQTKWMVYTSKSFKKPSEYGILHCGLSLSPASCHHYGVMSADTRQISRETFDATAILFNPRIWRDKCCSVQNLPIYNGSEIGA